jgi:hypothetical protein
MRWRLSPREWAYTSLIDFFSAEGPVAGRFKVRPDFDLNSLKVPLPMSRFACPKPAAFGPNGSPKGERSNAPVARVCQSIGCSPTSTASGNVNSLLSPKQASFCVSLPQSPPRTRLRSNSPKQARGVREQPLTTDHLHHMSPSGRLDVLGVRLSPAAYALMAGRCRPPGF